MYGSVDLSPHEYFDRKISLYDLGETDENDA